MTVDSEATLDARISIFLSRLYENICPPGYIETRIIEEKRGGRVLLRGWHPSPQSLLSEIDRFNRNSEKEKSAVFFGVLPRKDMKGTNADVAPGVTAWCDLDFRDFANGEKECRKRLAEFPLTPTFVVRSGHGLHAYWCMKEEERPEVLSSLSRRIAQALGGDHTFDAARLLRLPGTFNRKGDEPLPVVIEGISLGRSYSPSDFSFLPEIKTDPEAVQIKSVAIGAFPDRVQKLIDTNRRVKALNEGRGKTAETKDGKHVDTTSSGYDFSFICELIKCGITDPDDLATALWGRPDEAAQAKGMAYIQHTVAKALGTVKPKFTDKDEKGRGEAADFVVSKVRIIHSSPRIYEFTVDGKNFTVAAAELINPNTFAIKFMDALDKIPSLPRGTAWRDLVNGWLEAAEHVDVSQEATEEACIREEITWVLGNIGVGETVEDMERGKAIESEGGKVSFRLRPIQRMVRSNLGGNNPGLRRNTLCRHLKEMGFEPNSLRVGESVVRVWEGPRPKAEPQATVEDPNVSL